MKVDRAQFLMLTTAIASGGCATGQAPAATPEPVAIVISPVVTTQMPSPADAQAHEPAHEPDQTFENGSLGEDGDTDPDEQSLRTAPTTCSNRAVRVGSCALLRAPGPHCESFADTSLLCSSFVASLQPQVAEKAVSCLLSRSGKREICQFDVGSKCAVQALPSACVEPFTDQYCRAAVQVCAGVNRRSLSLRTCQQALSAVVPTKRSKMISCITESCSVDSCFFDLT